MKKIAAGIFIFFCLFCAGKVYAIDPATMTAAAPKALELAEIWSPHTISALQSVGIGFMEIGKSTLSILLLPAGILQCTLGAPFGYFGEGAQNCLKGICAPFELVYQVILLPVRIISLGTVR